MTVNSLGGMPADGRARTAAWYAPLVPIAISIFAVSALVSYHLRSGTITGARTFAQSLIVGIYEFFGWVPSCMFFGLVLAWSSIWWATGTIEQPGKKLARIGYLTLALAVFGNLDTAGPHTGALGAFLGGGLTAVFGSFLGHLLMAPLTFLCLLLATDYFWMSYFERRAYERALPAVATGSAASPVSTELGVEAAVTEEFKELARILPQHVAQPESEAESAAPHFEREVVGEALDRYFEAKSESEEPASSPVGGSLVGESDDEPMRMSYFERRQLRAAREAAASDSLEAAAFAAAGETEAEAVPASDEFVAADAERSIEAVNTDDESVDSSIAEALSSVDASSDSESTTAATATDEVPATAADASVGLSDEPLESSASSGVDSSEVVVPVLEETALRAALGFDAATEPVETEPVESEPAVEESEPQVELPRRESTYEVRHEPLFPTAAEVVDTLDEDEAAATAASDAAEVVLEPHVVESPSATDRPRGFLAPVREPEPEEAEATTIPSTQIPSAAAPSASPADAEADEDLARDASASTDEPVVAIPRPPEGPRQQSLFVGTLDEGLVRDALDVLQSNSRATASMLQRRLRIDYEQAKEVLALLAHRGLVELAEDGSQARRRG